MDARISFASSEPGNVRMVIECPGAPEEVERANLYITPAMGDTVDAMTQWTTKHAFFAEVEDEDALTALEATVEILGTLRENGLLNLSDIAL